MIVELSFCARFYVRNLVEIIFVGAGAGAYARRSSEQQLF